jgi:hypothetical protein
VRAVLLAACALRASRRLHARLVAALLDAPVALFDSTPSGAILNRFLQVSRACAYVRYARMPAGCGFPLKPLQCSTGCARTRAAP